MDSYTTGIDGRHSGRRNDSDFFKCGVPYLFEKSCFSCAGFTGQKNMAACMLYKLHSQLKTGIAQIGLHTRAN